MLPELLGPELQAAKERLEALTVAAALDAKERSPSPPSLPPSALPPSPLPPSPQQRVQQQPSAVASPTPPQQAVQEQQDAQQAEQTSNNQQTNKILKEY